MCGRSVCPQLQGPTEAFLRNTALVSLGNYGLGQYGNIRRFFAAHGSRKGSADRDESTPVALSVAMCEHPFESANTLPQNTSEVPR